MASKVWSSVEDDLVREHYPTLAATGMLKRGFLADRTREAINRRAYVLGVKFTKHTEMMEAFDAPWPVPTHEYTAPDLALRDYSYPVERGSLVLAIGVR